MLRGNGLAKVDGKGRLKLPAAFRSVIEPRYGKELFITSLRGESIRIYPMEVYTEWEERLLRASSVEPLVTRLRNALNYYGQRALIDMQGRVLLHPLVREATGIRGEVAVLGQQNHLEVWNRTAFEKHLSTNPLTEDDLRQLAQLGF